MSQCETWVAVPPNSASDHGQLVRLASFSSGMRRAQATVARTQVKRSWRVRRRANGKGFQIPTTSTSAIAQASQRAPECNTADTNHWSRRESRCRRQRGGRSAGTQAENIPRDQQRQAGAEEQEVVGAIGKNRGEPRAAVGVAAARSGRRS